MTVLGWAGTRPENLPDGAEPAVAVPGVEQILFAVRRTYDDSHWYANIGYFCDDENQKARSGDGGPAEGRLMISGDSRPEHTKTCNTTQEVESMRLLTCRTASGVRLAARRGDELVDLNQADPQLPVSLRELLAMGAPGLERAGQALAVAPSLDTPWAWLPPIPDPQKVICVGLNYADHAAESGLAIPDQPVIFNKFPSTLIGHHDPIELPACSNQVDYEAELVVVLGRSGRNIPEAEAMNYVAGYTCGHDVSARDWQTGTPAGQWLLGKTFDTFAPVGPELVTADEVPSPGQLGIQLRLNGQIMQQSNTGQLIFPIAHLIHYVSQVCTLNVGDLLFTGTPPGVGVARQPQVFLRAGDEVEVEIETIGVLSNRVAAAAARSEADSQPS